VTFEVDANGILQVSAMDKGTGKSEKITITAEKGRLSQEEIERMVREAEQFAEEDEVIKKRIDSRNALEGYAYNLKTQISDADKLKDKLSEEDSQTIEKAVQSVLDWLDENQEANAEDYQEKQKELEATANPIIKKVYDATGGAGGAGGSSGGGDEDFNEDL